LDACKPIVGDLHNNIWNL